MSNVQLVKCHECRQQIYVDTAFVCIGGRWFCSKGCRYTWRGPATDDDPPELDLNNEEDVLINEFF